MPNEAEERGIELPLPFSQFVSFVHEQCGQLEPEVRCMGLAVSQRLSACCICLDGFVGGGGVTRPVDIKISL